VTYLGQRRHDAASRLARRLNSTKEKILLGWEKELPRIELKESIVAEMALVSFWAANQLASPLMGEQYAPALHKLIESEPLFTVLPDRVSPGLVKTKR